jgi:AcrR family transcriptional regulator
MAAFWRRGYAGVSLADLTETMGIAAPSLYAAFGNKEALFREAVAHYRATQGAFLARALGEESTARSALTRLLHGAADAYAARGRPRGCLIVSGATNCAVEDEGVVRFLAAQRAATLGAIRSRLERALAEGELPAGACPDALADYFAAVLEGISLRARDGASRRSLHAIADVAVQAWPSPSP